MKLDIVKPSNTCSEGHQVGDVIQIDDDTPVSQCPNGHGLMLAPNGSKCFQCDGITIEPSEEYRK